MKKRLWALALCLVMVVILLPITALADELIIKNVCVAGNGEEDVNGNWVNGFEWMTVSSNFMSEVSNHVYEITYNNVKRGTSPFKLLITFNVDYDYDWGDCFGGTFVASGVETDAEYNVSQKDIKFNSPYDLANITIRLDLRNFNYTTKNGAKFTITITDANHDFDTGWTSDATHHWHKCLNEGCTEVKDKALHVDNNNDHFCDDCQVSIHTWKFSKTDSGTFMATCNPGCTIGKVTVKLNAHSVTLPDSPFHATVEVSENFKEAFPNAQVTGPKYVYFESGKPVDVTRDSFTPKAGQYQAQAYIDGLPGGGEIAARAVGNEDGIVGTHVDLWVDYTAADPKVTAQTGDNRPIELMMGSLVVFSALAAAAFILDNKRKYSR